MPPPLAQPRALADKARHGGKVVGQHRDPLALVDDFRERWRQFRTLSGRALDRVGEFCRVRGRQRDHRRPAVVAAKRGARGGNRDRRVRVDQQAAAPIGLGDFGERAGIVDPVAGKRLPGGLPGLVVGRQRTVAAEGGDRLRDGGAVAALQLEQQPLEIARDLDVHARAKARADRRQAHLAARQIAREDVVCVGRQHQALDRQPHRPRQVRRVDIAEIAGRHRERHRPARRAERQPGGDVIDDLRGDAGEVDRVHRRQAEVAAQRGVGEQRLHQILAIVESALDRDRMRVRRVERGHLPALHLGDAAVRIEEEDVDRGAVAAGFERRRAGIARGRADDRHPLAAPRQRRIEQMTEQLQRQILERQRRPVKQLQQPQPLVELDQRRHRRVAEPGIGRLAHPAHFAGPEAVAGEEADDPRRQIGIGKTGERRQIELRQRLGHVKSAILGEPGEQHVLEGQTRRLRPGIAGREIAHARAYS